MTELKIAAESATGLTMKQTYWTSFEAASPRIGQQPTLDFMGVGSLAFREPLMGQALLNVFACPPWLMNRFENTAVVTSPRRQSLLCVALANQVCGITNVRHWAWQVCRGVLCFGQVHCLFRARGHYSKKPAGLWICL